MAINTLITIRDAIQAFVDGHGQLQAVRFGADDKRAPYLTEQELFPVLYVAPIDVEVGRAHNTHRLRVYVYERLNDADQDEWENANDTSLILRDIRVWWNDYGVDDILIETDPTGTFKTDSELDNLVGYYAEILFQIPSHGRCDVPVSIEPIPPIVGCLPANYVVEYADGTPIESGEIPSGGSVTVVVPNCPPAGDVVWRLFDTDGNVLDSGTEPAGGALTIVAPDATFDINGVQVATIPSGGSDSIEVRRASGSTQIGSLQGQHWRVANTTVQLRDSAANNIGSVNSYGAESSNNLTAPDGTVTVNRDGVFFDTVPVASGGTASINVPSNCPAPIVQGALPIKTFQTTPQGTGSDGDTQMGRGATHNTLPYNNLHGNTTRFLDMLGTTAFANDILCDWLSWDGRVGTILQVYFGSDVLGTNRNFDDGRDYCNTIVAGGFSDWVMINKNQLEFLANNDASLNDLNFAPLNIGALNIGTSTAYTATRVSRTTGGATSSTAKTTITRTLAVRIANVALVGSTVVYT
jgi:hypothetical protein